MKNSARKGAKTKYSSSEWTEPTIDLSYGSVTIVVPVDSVNLKLECPSHSIFILFLAYIHRERNDVKHKDIFVADDIIATGDSMLKLCTELKAAGCGRIFLSATYALFTEGPEKFQKAYDAGLFDAVLSTLLS